MLLNYHELTMGESRNSPARRKQFLIICSVMAAVLIYSLLTSGILITLDIQEGTFPGGDFVYKYTARDYAASMGLVRHVAGHLKLKERQYEDVMYSLYLDDSVNTGGRRQRFACGVLLNDHSRKSMRPLAKQKKKPVGAGDTAADNDDFDEGMTLTDRKRMLLEKNDPKQDPPTEQQIQDMPAQDLWKLLNYESHKLPGTSAGIVHFPFTNGFVSALILSFKASLNNLYYRK